MAASKIIYTKTDEAPALATQSLLPIVQAFAKTCDIDPCLSEAVAASSLETILGMQDMLVESGRTSAPVDISPDAPVTDRFLAATGRQVGV